MGKKTGAEAFIVLTSNVSDSQNASNQKEMDLKFCLNLNRFYWLLAICLMLAGCGGSGGSSSGITGTTDSTDGLLTRFDVGVQVNLEPAVRTQGEANSPFRGLQARLLNQGILSSQDQVTLTGEEATASLNFQSIAPGQYTVEIDGLDANGNIIAQASSPPITVSPGQPQVATLVLEAPGNTGTTGPIANADSYNAVRGVVLNIPAADGVLANDVSTGGTVTLLTQPTTGIVVLNADGSFTYDPNDTRDTTETFTYELTDSTGTSTATVTLNIVTRALFVRAGATGDGTLANPRGDLDGAFSDAQSGEIVFILNSPDPLVPGVGTSTITTLPEGVQLIGEASGLNIGGQEIVPPGQRPLVTARIGLSNNVRVSGFRAENPTSVCFQSGGTGNFTFDDMEIVNGGRQFLFLNMVGDLTVTNSLLEGGSPLGITMDVQTRGNSDITFDGNRSPDGSTLSVDARDAGNTTNVTWNNNVTGSRVSITYSDSAGGNIVMRGNQFAPSSSGAFGSILLTNNSGGGDNTIDISDNTFTEFNVVSYGQTSSSFSNSTAIFQNNNFSEGSSTQLNYTANSGGEHQVTMLNNDVSAGVDVFVRGNANLSLRFEDNTIARAVRLFTSGAGNPTMNLGVLNNGIGKANDGMGFRNLQIFAEAGRICARVKGNDVGTLNEPTFPLQVRGDIVINESVLTTAREIDVEDLATIQTDNTAGGFQLDPGLMSVPSGTCVFPPRP